MNLSGESIRSLRASLSYHPLIHYAESTNPSELISHTFTNRQLFSHPNQRQLHRGTSRFCDCHVSARHGRVGAPLEEEIGCPESVDKWDPIVDFFWVHRFVSFLFQSRI